MFTLHMQTLGIGMVSASHALWCPLLPQHSCCLSVACASSSSASSSTNTIQVTVTEARTSRTAYLGCFARCLVCAGASCLAGGWQFRTPHVFQQVGFRELQLRGGIHRWPLRAEKVSKSGCASLKGCTFAGSIRSKDFWNKDRAFVTTSASTWSPRFSLDCSICIAMR